VLSAPFGRVAGVWPCKKREQNQCNFFAAGLQPACYAAKKLKNSKKLPDPSK